MKRILLVLLLCISGFAQEVLRPTVDVDMAVGFGVCSGLRGTSSAMPNAYDASGTSTSSALSVSQTLVTNTYRVRVFSGWGSPGGAYSTLVLKVNNACSRIDSGPYGTEQCSIIYSLDSGSTWITFTGSNAMPHTQATFQVSLSASQDLSQLRVGACVSASSDGAHSVTSTNTVYDIWTEGSIRTETGHSYVIVAKK